MPTAKSYTGYVYLIGSSRYGWFKIGKSKNAEVRTKDLGVMLPFKVDLYALWITDNHSRLESSFHCKYSKYALHGEWFRFGGSGLKSIIEEEPPYFAERLFPKRTGDFRSIKSSLLQDIGRPRSRGTVRDAHYKVLSTAIRECVDRYPEGNEKIIKGILKKSVKELWNSPLDIFIEALDACMQQLGSVEPGSARSINTV